MKRYLSILSAPNEGHPLVADFEEGSIVVQIDTVGEPVLDVRDDLHATVVVQDHYLGFFLLIGILTGVAGAEIANGFQVQLSGYIVSRNDLRFPFRVQLPPVHMPSSSRRVMKSSPSSSHCAVRENKK